MTRAFHVLRALSLLIALVSGTSIAAESVVLSPEHIGIAKQQCSRPVPKGIEGAWMPSAAEAAAVDAALLPIERFEAVTIVRPYPVIDPYSYARQYVGVIIHGRRLIYINAFPASWIKQQYRNKPFMACDGGTMFWGALYDPQTHQFSDIAANGDPSMVRD